jgi:hypothetical protein
VHLAVLASWDGNDTLALTLAQSALDIAVAVQDRRIEVGALCCLGNAELALGRYHAAAVALDRAQVVALGLFDKCDAASRLARVALAQDDVAGAMLQVESVLAHLQGGGKAQGADSTLILLTCYQVLQRARDARAAEMLASAHAAMQARAATITDATLRHGFLNNIPEHRAIAAAWASYQTAALGGH